MKKLIVFLIVVLLTIAAAYIFYKEGSLPVDKTNSTEKIFVIDQGEKLDSIINDLAKEGLIRNRLVFYWIIKQKGIEKKLQAGTFRLSTAMDAYTLADKLTHGKPLDNWVTIPEGLRKEEIAAILAKKFQISESIFLSLSKEGYLFPDTYLIPIKAAEQDIINIMKNNFDRKYNESLKERKRTNNLTKEEIIVLASIIEREAVGDIDRQEIANILLRRLTEDIPLQVDATVQYALGYQPQENRWWKKELTFNDLKIDSPYNTYIYNGLPPSPISNPGKASLLAAMDADSNTPYLFYLHDRTGITRYAKTSQEHQNNIQKYLNQKQ